MGYILSAMFLIVAILCYLEDYIRKYQKPLFFLIGLVLIFVAGFREIGLDPDSENYQNTFQHYFKNGTDEMVEPSFLLISYLWDSLQTMYTFCSCSMHCSECH